MFVQPTISEKIYEIEAATSHEEQLHKSIDVYIELFPVKNAFLFRYSHLGYLAEGVISFDNKQYMNISSIRDDVRSIPGIYAALKEGKAKYYSGADYLKQMGTKYVFSHTSGLAVPIAVHSTITGYFISNQFEENHIFDENMLASLTNFGKLLGKSLYHFNDPVKDVAHLSKRELQVMRKIANGESTKEIAATLYISEVTVNQYVKTAIKKLGAKNRTEAAVELLRKGLIV